MERPATLVLEWPIVYAEEPPYSYHSAYELGGPYLKCVNQRERHRRNKYTCPSRDTIDTPVNATNV
jgi:hypothetical protein